MTAFLLLNAGAALVAWLAGSRESSRSAAILGALAGYLVVIHSAVLLCGLLGSLTTTTVALVVTATVVVALGWAWRARRRRDCGTDERGAWHAPTAAALFVLGAAVVAAGEWGRPHLVEETRLWVWDDYTYHMVYPALWLRDHAVAAVEPARAFTMQAWFPLSASVVAAWFMLPFHGVRAEALAWVSLTGPLYAAVVLAAVVEALRRTGCRPGAWAIALLLFATSPRVTWMAGSFSDADLAHASALFAAFVFAIPRDEGEERDAVRADGWRAALLTGLALGIKVTALVPALVVLAMQGLRERARASTPGAPWRAAARTASIFALAWAVTGGYWYARNVVHTGNPLYPARFLIWPGATFPETRLVDYAERWGLRKTILDAVEIYTGWPVFHAALAVGALLGVGVWWAWRRSDVTRSRAYFVAGALAVTLAVLLVLPRAPFSAGNAMTLRAGLVHWDSMRYVGVLPLLGWTALAFLLDAGAGASRARQLAAVVLAAAGLLASGHPWLASPVFLVALAVASGALAWGWPSIVRAVAARTRVVAAALAILGVGLVVSHHGAKARATASSIHRDHLFGAAAAVLDRQPRGTRVAIFGDQWVYPTLGARDHLVPVRLDGDGRVATTPIGDGMTQGPLAAPPRALLANLKAAAIDVVVVLHLTHPGRSAEWPAQHAALGVSGGARSLLRGEMVAVWAIDGGRGIE